MNTTLHRNLNVFPGFFTRRYFWLLPFAYFRESSEIQKFHKLSHYLSQTNAVTTSWRCRVWALACSSFHVAMRADVQLPGWSGFRSTFIVIIPYETASVSEDFLGMSPCLPPCCEGVRDRVACIIHHRAFK